MGALHQMSAVDPMGELLPNEQTAEEDDLTKSIETFTPSHSTSMNDLPKEEQVVTILSDEISLPTLNALTSSPYWEDNRDNGGATDNEFNYGTNSSSADNENSKATNTNLTFHPSELARGNIEKNEQKDVKLSAPNQFAKPCEIVEALGIAEEEKLVSFWKSLAKRLSLAPTRQQVIPIQIKPPKDLKKKPQSKTTSKKPKKKVLRANPAMSKLTRLASTKIDMYDLDMFLDDQEEQNDSNHRSQLNNDSELKMPSPLPYAPDTENLHRSHVNQNIPKLKVVPPILQTNRIPPARPRPSDPANATTSNDRELPTKYHHGIIQSNVNHLGHSTSKPGTHTSNKLPPQLLRPSIEVNVQTSRNDITDDFLHSTGGGLQVDNDMSISRQQGHGRYVERKGDDYDLGDDMKQSIGLTTYEDDYGAECNGDVATNKGWNSSRNGEEELDFYAFSNARYSEIALKGNVKQLAHALSASKTRDFSYENKPVFTDQIFSDMKDPLDQTRPIAAAQRDQHMYRRVSASGHVSLSAQSDTLGAPPHESPFADYTTHALKELGRKSSSGTVSVNGSYTHSSYDADHATHGGRSLPQADSPSQGPNSQMGIGADAAVRPDEVQGQELRTGIEHANLTPIPTVVANSMASSSAVQVLKHESPVRENSNGGDCVDLLVGDPAARPPPVFGSMKRSPWASNTGDPSHSVSYTDQAEFAPHVYASMPSSAAPHQHITSGASNPQQRGDGSRAEESASNGVEATAAAPRRSTGRYRSPSNTASSPASIPSPYSRVSLYSSIDIPSYTQLLSVVPSRRTSHQTPRTPNSPPPPPPLPQ